MTSRAAACLAAATGVLALAGCGGSSLSDRDLRADASAVCSAANARSARLPSPRSPAAGGKFLRNGISVLAPELAALKGLGPPSDLARRYEAALALLSRALAELRAASEGIRRGADPLGTFQALEPQIAPLVAEQNASWQSLQIPACKLE